MLLQNCRARKRTRHDMKLFVMNEKKSIFFISLRVLFFPWINMKISAMSFHRRERMFECHKRRKKGKKWNQIRTHKESTKHEIQSQNHTSKLLEGDSYFVDVFCLRSQMKIINTRPVAGASVQRLIRKKWKKKMKRKMSWTTFVCAYSHELSNCLCLKVYDLDDNDNRQTRWR